MKTDQLIEALAADTAPAPKSILANWPLALSLGALAAVVLMTVTIHVRPDIATAVHQPRFLFKFVATLSLAAPAVWVVHAWTRPEHRLGRGALWLLIAPALTLVAVAVELAIVPSADWAARLIGHNAAYCVPFVPLLSLAPLAGILVALRHGAPSQTRIAGLMAGVAAGAIGATAYAMHCPDDSPLFVMVWYTLGIGIAAGIGAIIGPRVLRW